MWSKKSIIPVFLPLIIVSLVFYLITSTYPGSITGIDPEYVCLLNGLKISILQFDNIGFTDSPGTPFLVVTGVLLRLVHLFAGNGAILEDVLLRPDFYLQMSSYLLLAFTFMVLIWGGRKVYEATNNVYAVIFIQGAFLLSPINTMLQSRFNMDRLLPIITFILTVHTVLYLHNKINAKKYAIYAGILMGVGLITKFNFIVLAFIPLILLQPFRLWLVYGTSFVLSSIVSFLPIIDKYQNFTRFIKKLIFHQGTYGGGEKGILNLEMILDSFHKMVVLNQAFVLICCISLVAVIISLLKNHKRENSKYILLIGGVLFVTIIEVLLASKIFKNSYMAPAVAMSGIMLFSAYHLFSSSFILNKRIQNGIVAGLFILLVIPTFIEAKENSEVNLKRVSDRQNMSEYIEKNILPNEYLLIEPTWKAGPTHLNGIIYGLSYISARNEFTNTYLKLYPKVLTYENDNRPFKHCRTKDADIEKILSVDNSVYMISTPIRRTENVMKELAGQASLVNMQTHFDTVFSNDNNTELLVQATFSENIEPVQYSTFSYLNTMEIVKENWKQNSLSKEQAASGLLSSKIKRGNKYSSICEIDSISTFASEIHSFVINCKYFQTSTTNSARLVVEIFNSKNERFWYPVKCTDFCMQINKWDEFAYKIIVPLNFRHAQKANVYFYNSSKQPVYIDDFEVELIVKD